MKIQIPQESLAKAISLASRFTSNRAQLPILGNILLKVDKTKLIVSSTNLEVSVSSQLTVKAESDGEISIPSKVISELISNLPKEVVTLESDKEQLKINTSSFNSKVLGMNTSDFPKIPNVISEKNSVKIPSAKLLEALDKVIFAASVDETRPVLTGVLFVLEKGFLTIVATDGFRLSKKKIVLEEYKGEVVKMIIPKFILSELSRSSDSEMIDLEFLSKEKQVLFGLGNVVLSSRVLEGEYPDFEKIIPKSSTYKISVDKEDFLRAIKLSAPFARDNSNIVKLIASKGNLKISAESSTSGNQEMSLEAKIEGEVKSFEISFNFKFLEDFLGTIDKDLVQIEFLSTDKAGTFLDLSDSEYLHLIMPVRVQS